MQEKEQFEAALVGIIIKDTHPSSKDEQLMEKLLNNGSVSFDGLSDKTKKL